MDRTVTLARDPAARVAIGILVMSAASLIVPVVDSIAKFLGSVHSPFFVAWARYAVASLIIPPLTLMTYRSDYDLRQDFAANIVRTILSVSAMSCFFFAITRIPLTTAFGGYFLGPVIATLTAPLLGERLTPGRLGAAVLGLSGAYLIVKPGADLDIGSLLAVMSGGFFAGYLVATRMAATRTPPIDALRFQCVVGALLLTPLALLNWSWPTPSDVVLIAAMGTISAICHFLVIAAFRFAEVSILSPLTYLELVTATMIGQLVFAELPDVPAFAGTGLIVASGLLIWLMGRRQHRT